MPRLFDNSREMTFSDPERVCEEAQQYLKKIDHLPQFQDPRANGTLVETPYGVGILCGVDSHGRASVQLGTMRLCIKQALVRFLPEKIPSGKDLDGSAAAHNDNLKRDLPLAEEEMCFFESDRKCKRC
ncbi:hypothetical protein Pmar_PMAR018214 [Perkinsus marinus ATCC 50983]|uniref:Uncharacterized protein n=1 Tax=Perkinsus marinus (strain ATCC 50983 / TXsc) TaxID=423536 RepID=C5KZ63_PERM5|nr:hypothetical protein Pmar_PMAR018214 [Perkinsus marinus ATCC 50983]EER10213.1 hypothetical protein Pmar_PMAR018214 [Perkinsus marinus ATCC 50983]|eukprot:XP_002778418.1 hypothetical protein Pmar_PMAR018214 [Perkinsus marinus ATCC 50983]